MNPVPCKNVFLSMLNNLQEEKKKNSVSFDTPNSPSQESVKIISYQIPPGNVFKNMLNDLQESKRKNSSKKRNFDEFSQQLVPIDQIPSDHAESSELDFADDEYDGSDDIDEDEDEDKVQRGKLINFQIQVPSKKRVKTIKNMETLQDIYHYKSLFFSLANA